MKDVTVACGCGRKVSLDALRGRGAYRCGCGARIKIEVPPYSKDRCVGRVDNRRCRFNPVTGDPVPLCKTCLKAMKLANGLIRPEEVGSLRPGVDKDEYLRQLAERKALDDAAVWAGRPADWVERSVAAIETSVVYYILFGDRIKIGTTTNLAKRLQALPCDELLATEPGGSELERRRHTQFGVYRVTGEWFEMGDELVDHVNDLREQKYRADGLPERLRKYLPQHA